MAAAIPAMQNADGHLDASASLLAAISASPESFLQPTVALHTAAIIAAKRLLDPLAEEVAELQTTRRDENRKKRKRGDYDGPDTVLQLRQVYTSGFGISQIWEQSRRILGAASDEVARDLRDAVEDDGNGVHTAQTNGEIPEQSDGEDMEDLDGKGEKDIEFQDGGDEFDDVMGAEEDDFEEEEDMEALDDKSESDKDHDLATYVQDPNKLNDGFFSIDDFNKQSQFLEHMDARGDNDNPSDEDEVDWDADPLAVPLKSSKLRRRKDPGESDDEESREDEDGPTFGNADLDAANSEDEGGAVLENGDLDDQMAGLVNTNEIKYSDFFEPPPKKPSKTKRMRALPKTQPSEPSQNKEETEEDIQRAIYDVRRDLFDSGEEFSGDDPESGSDARAVYSSKQSDKNLSAHEKQRAKIAAEIRRLEAANVAKRHWTLSGEARAADRPMNSLIEENLEFERAGKPVPVITAEVSEEIEQLIKRRIIAREFDEVVRRRPDAIGTASETRRGRIELDDAKPTQGLAEIYEQEHLASTDPGYIDKRSAATKKQHAEIERLWKEVSGQLDLLSNLHFKPKRVEVEIKTVDDKPVVSMEDARPIGAGGEESRLAPQEIYRPGEDGRASGEVVRKSGANVSKEELTREEKVRKRRREKERLKKAKGDRTVAEAKAERKNGKKSKKAEQEDILSQLKKGGVKVVGKKGELQELGKKGGHTGAESVSALKL